MTNACQTPNHTEITVADIEGIVARRMAQENRIRDRAHETHDEKRDSRRGGLYLVVEFVFAVTLICVADLPKFALIVLTVPDVVQVTTLAVKRAWKLWHGPWITPDTIQTADYAD